MPIKYHKQRHPGDHEIAECNHTVHGQFIHGKSKGATEGKNLVKLRQSIDVRNIIVPNVEPLETPGILAKKEFLRLKKQAHVITPSEKKVLKDEIEKKKMVDHEESVKRKEYMRKSQLDQTAVKGSGLEEVESEAAKNSQYLLQRAYEMRQEQEDEIKGANRIILASKCLAIREAQIAEKDLIRKELDEEEKRLDRMMEQQRQIGLREEKKMRDKAEERNQKFVASIRQQLKENEIQQLIEAERKEEEAKVMTQALIAMQKEEEEKVREKFRKRVECQAELKKANADMEKYKALQKEEERLADARLKHFMKMKEQRELAAQKELAELKLSKEREIKRLKDSQVGATDLQEHQAEMRAFRDAEEAERKWRNEEMAAAIKKKQTVDQLRKDRENQIEELRKMQALEQARDEAEFHKVAEMQFEILKKEKEKERIRHEKASQHRKDILKQVDERERARIEERKSKMDEGYAIRLENELRAARIKETLERKIDKLRDHNVPDHTMKDIHRQINAHLSRAKF